MNTETIVLERLTDNVFRARPNDIKKHLNALFELLRDHMRCNFSYIVATKRQDSKINGSSKFIGDIENDYRSWYLIIVKPGVCYEEDIG